MLSMDQYHERLLFALTDSINGFGVALHQIILDEHHQPVDYTFLSVNRAFEAMTGLVASDVLGQRATIIFPTMRDGSFDWIGTYGRVALEGVEEEFEQYLPSLDRWFHVLAYCPEHGSFVTIIQNVTDKKSMEIALRESEERYRLLFQKMTEGVVFHKVIYDEQDNPIDYRILDVNAGFERMLQIPASAIMGKLASEAYGVGVAPFLDIYARVADTGISEQFQTPFGSQVFDIRAFSPKHRHFITMFFDITEQVRVQQERADMQQHIIDAQRDALRELSTPLIPIAEHVVVMPLVGTIDSQRAQMVLEMLLQGVVNHRAATVILDITGVQVVDTQVADALVHSAKAVRLLGAQVIVSGIRPQIAQTLIHLGVDLSSIQTVATVQVAVAKALRQVSVTAGL